MGASRNRRPSSRTSSLILSQTEVRATAASRRLSARGACAYYCKRPVPPVAARGSDGGCDPNGEMENYLAARRATNANGASEIAGLNVIRKKRRSASVEYGTCECRFHQGLEQMNEMASVGSMFYQAPETSEYCTSYESLLLDAYL